MEQVYEFLARGHSLTELGPENVFATRSDATGVIFKRLDRDACDNRPTRAFLERHIVARNNLQDAVRAAKADAAAA